MRRRTSVSMVFWIDLSILKLGLLQFQICLPESVWRQQVKPKVNNLLKRWEFPSPLRFSSIGKINSHLGREGSQSVTSLPLLVDFKNFRRLAKSWVFVFCILLLCGLQSDLVGQIDIIWVEKVWTVSLLLSINLFRLFPTKRPSLSVGKYLWGASSVTYFEVILAELFSRVN